jgi:O-antigen/teichoic acid export membrane protein
MKLNKITDTIASVSAQIFQKLLLLAVSSLLSSSVSPSEYGRFALARSFTNFLDTSISASLYPIIVRSVQGGSYTQKKLKNLILRIILIFLLLSVVIFYYLNETDLFLFMEIIWLFSMSICILLSGITTSVLQGEMKFKIPMYASLLSFIVTIFASFNILEITFINGVILISCFFGIDFLAKLVLFFNSHISMNTQNHISHKNKMKNTSKLNRGLGIALIASLTNGLFFLYYRNFFASMQDGLSLLGNIDIGFQLLAAVFMIINAFTLVFFSEINKCDCSIIAFKKLKVLLLKTSILSVVLFLGVSFISDAYYNFLFSSANSMFFGALALSIPVYSICLSLNRYIIYLNKQSVLFVSSIIGGICGVAFLHFYSLSLKNIGLIYFLYYFVVSICISTFILLNNSKLRIINGL